MKRLLLFCMVCFCVPLSLCAQDVPTLVAIQKEVSKNLKEQQQLLAKQTQLEGQITTLKQQLVALPTAATAEAKEQLSASLAKAQQKFGQLNQKMNELHKLQQALEAKMSYIRKSNLQNKALEATKKQDTAIKEKLIKKTPDDLQLLLREKPPITKQLFLETGAGLILKNNVAGHISSIVGIQVSNRLAFGLGGEFRNYLANGDKIAGLWSGKLMGQFHITKILYLRVEQYAGLPTVSKLKESETLTNWAWAQMGGFGLSLPAFDGKLVKVELLRTINQHYPAIGQQLYSPYKAQINLQF